MKQFFLILAGMAYLASLHAQPNGYCGTHMPDDIIDWLTAHQLASAGQAGKQGSPGQVYYIPVKIHVVGDDNGSGYHKTQTILDGLCTLNKQYEQVGFHFYIYGDFNYINHSGLYEHTSGVNSTVAATRVPNAANVYYVLDPDGNCGYFSGGSRDFIAIAKSCAGPTNSTVAHEFGHYFSLPHTFFGWEGRDPNTANATAFDERVNGSNCLTAGDRFCDTPADYLSDRWSCPYNKTKLDYNGDQYQVDGTLFMSYSNDACQNRFSAEQINAMRAYLLSVRSNLLAQPEPAKDSVGLTTLVYPPDGSTGIPPNFAHLRWRKVPGATRYHVLVTRYFNGNFFNADTLVQDTSILLNNLEPNVNYRWKVRALNEGYTCASYTVNSNFITSGVSAITTNFQVNDVSCFGQLDGFIQVTPSGGTPPYTFSWSNGATDNEVHNLSAGNYRVTITDSDSNSVQLQFSIAEPEPLQAQLVFDGSSLRIIASGGTPPYTYTWSDGSSGSQNTNPMLGNTYSITVSDSRGCLLFKNYTYTGTENADFVENLRVYPNPIQHDKVIVVEFGLKNPHPVAIEIFDPTGRMVWAVAKSFAAGTNKELIALPNLAAGVYSLRIAGDKFQSRTSFVVF
ncbi:MAG: hypothetical protein KatS3mg031_0478 [Chitinophagales bacterium]|nr:MAG: hypothetical protein KatS3mg031_0478 [Chitinophagales bacterium]